MEKRLAATALVLIAGGAIAAYAGFEGVSFDTVDVSNIGGKFLSLVLIALVIERAIEVFVDAGFSSRENRVRRPIRIARLDTIRAQENLDAEVARPLPTNQSLEDAADAREKKSERIAKNREELHESQAHLKDCIEENAAAIEALGDEKKSFASRLSLGFGLAAALIGVRVLGQLLPSGTSQDATGLFADGEVQYFLFNTFDVAVTALLLAGGSQGIHNLIGGFLSKKNILDKPG